jgi:hypothetical protein
MSVPALGFGTAPILGRLGRQASLDALRYAHELGVRHFDTARSYGWGEAEAVLGGFLSSVSRERCTVVSKCGRVPVPRTGFMSAAKTFARAMMAVLPASGRLVRRVASSPRFQPSLTYDVRLLQDSFEASLRELRTSYIDVLLLHNFDVALRGLPEVAAWMRELQRQGSIKQFGFCVDGDLHAGLAYLEHAGLLGDCVIQAPVSESLLALPGEWRSVEVIAHSPFQFLSQRASPQPGPRSLRELMEELSEVCACRALVCSMFSREHIAQNVEASIAAGRASSVR